MMSDKGHYEVEPDAVTLAEYLANADLTNTTTEYRAWWSARVTRVTVRRRPTDEMIKP